LEKFKIRATTEIKKKDKMVKKSDEEREKFQAKLFNIRGKLFDRKVKDIKNILSDSEMESDAETEPEQKDLQNEASRLNQLMNLGAEVNEAEMNLAKEQKKKLRGEIKTWCNDFIKENSREPVE